MNYENVTVKNLKNMTTNDLRAVVAEFKSFKPIGSADSIRETVALCASICATVDESIKEGKKYSEATINAPDMQRILGLAVYGGVCSLLDDRLGENSGKVPCVGKDEASDCREKAEAFYEAMLSTNSPEKLLAQFIILKQIRNNPSKVRELTDEQLEVIVSLATACMAEVMTRVVEKK